MTAIGALRSARASARHGGLYWTVSDALAVTRRHLLGYIRIPRALFHISLQPIMFVLMFRFVFGGAVDVGGIAYIDFLIPGAFVQAALFGGTSTAVGLADDIGSGLIERFRSLPMARSAVLAGRTLADLARGLFVVLLMFGLGYLLGFRVHTGILPAIGGIALVLLFSYAFSWLFAYVALHAHNGEMAQLMVFPIVFPLTFASSALVRPDTMPGWLQVFANNQPITKVVDAVRLLMIGGPVTTAVLHAVLWSLGILAVFLPLAVARYRRMS